MVEVAEERNTPAGQQGWQGAGSASADLTVLRDEAGNGAVSALREDVKRGFSAGFGDKALPADYLYDEVGSVLFAKITGLEQYYVTRKEVEVLQRNAADIVRNFAACTEPGTVLNVIELGVGDGRKTCVLLDELLRQNVRFEFFPIDISRKAIEMLSVRMHDRYGARVKMHCVVGDNLEALEWVRRSFPDRRNVTLFLGNPMAVFDREQAKSFLSSVREALHKGDRFFVGFDLLKDPEILRSTYIDPEHLWETMYRNVLSRINRELGANFAPESFYYVPTYNVQSLAVEIYLVSAFDQTVSVPGAGDFELKNFEGIRITNLFKYSPQIAEQLAERSGFRVDETYYDSEKWFMDQIWAVK